MLADRHMGVHAFFLPSDCYLPDPCIVAGEYGIWDTHWNGVDVI